MTVARRASRRTKGRIWNDWHTEHGQGDMIPDNAVKVLALATLVVVVAEGC